MHISQVTNAIKIGKFVIRNGRLKVLYEEDVEKLASSRKAWVYIFTVGGEIVKIGGTAAKGGLKAALSFYENADQGSPGRPRFIIHELIVDLLRNEHNVEVYAIPNECAKAKIKTLFNQKEAEMCSFKEAERECLEEYKAKEGRYPKWNFQENNEPYPKEYEERFLNYHERRLQNRG